MITNRVRTYGRLHGAIGVFFTALLVLFCIGFVVVFLDAADHRGEYGFSWWDVAAQALTISSLTAICGAFVAGCFWYMVTNERDCNKWDATTAAACARFQRNIGRTGADVTGLPDAGTLDRLSKDTRIFKLEE
jgi:uncharacterized BrkB/YihY/UPF0761 family membrane protein